jgi:hypothetical protein
MSAPQDFDPRVAAWMTQAAEGPVAGGALKGIAPEIAGGALERIAPEIARRRPRPAWRARVHDRWAHGAGPMGRHGADLGLLAIAAILMLTLAGLVGGLVPGRAVEHDAIGPTAPSPVVPKASPPASASSGTVVTGPEVGPMCRSDARATLPTGPLPVSVRPAGLPTNDGRLLVQGGLGQAEPALLDPATGQVQPVRIQSAGRPIVPDVLPDAASPDGHWLALRWGYWSQLSSASCGNELIVSSDGTSAVDVTDYPPGRGAEEAAWSPDGRWLAVDTRDRIDVYAIGADGRVSDARTVWLAGWRVATLGGGAIGPAWGPEGTLAFQVVDPTSKAGSGTTVALLGPGASAPRLVHVPADALAPLAWTTDGSAVIAKGDIGASDVGMFRITLDGASRIALPGLHLHGGKFLDVPVAIVGDRIVFDAYPDPSAPESVSVYTMRPDGTDLTRLTGDDFPLTTGVIFAPAPDGRHVAIAPAGHTGIWIADTSDGTRQQVASSGGGPMSWQPVP